MCPPGFRPRQGGPGGSCRPRRPDLLAVSQGLKRQGPQSSSHPKRCVRISKLISKVSLAQAGPTICSNFEPRCSAIPAPQGRDVEASQRNAKTMPGIGGQFRASSPRAYLEMDGTPGLTPPLPLSRGRVSPSFGINYEPMPRRKAGGRKSCDSPGRNENLANKSKFPALWLICREHFAWQEHEMASGE